MKYNGKKDGYNIDIFHEKWDNIRRNVIICKTSSEATIGAYMTTNIENRKDLNPNVFLFNLTNKIMKKNLKHKYEISIYNYDDNSNFIKFGECD